MTGCASVQSPVGGALYLDAKGPITATTLPVGSVKGEACATTILGMVGTGDASIKAAMMAGGISKVAAVDHSSWAILGVFGKYCTVVYGTKGGVAKAAKKAPAPAASDDDDF